jgi:hypothetical protein
MARVEIRVSDLTQEPIRDDEQAARLTVEHPDYPEPIGLDVLPDEVTPHLTDENSRFVVVSVEEPDNPTPTRHVLSLTEFNDLFDKGDANEALDQAYSQQQEEQRSRRRGGRRGSGKRHQLEPRQQKERIQKERINYATTEHAGEPHRGTVSEAEAEIVRNNLDEVNDRLRRDGFREIDPTDPEIAARYKFPPPVDREDVPPSEEEPLR